MSNLIGEVLSEDDRRLLNEYRTSEAFRVFAKAVNHMILTETANLVSSQTTPEELFRRQGILQGLSRARSLLYLAVVPNAESKAV